ncbi:hypothetical protein GCM10011495_00870 [Hymenobacter frigidus]|uniref:DUF5683 domain-containing protein n=1 Tax=Hymenobacter frigidus TaxID=1524095 RepID=A0ABQ1ZTU2_9BACT|nr:DUF5683 domain-containing protein [Hymenobacter frigidus]GGH78524.1 hypothetical protein GCM10011495_00870 [Hymenobacter frigidus]
MKKSFTSFLALLIFGGLLLASATSRAQVVGPPPEPTVVVSDTTETRVVVVTPEARRLKEAADSAKRTEHMFRAFGYKGIRLTRPGKAALLAALLPGAGQIYNRRYWKLPLVYGALGGVLYGEYFYQSRYREFADAVNAVEVDPSNLQNVNDLGLVRANAAKVPSLDGLRSGVVFYRGNRDIFYLYIGLAYSLQIVDALVDAHLRDFDVSDDLTFHWEPILMSVPGQAAALPTAPGLSFALRVK